MSRRSRPSRQVWRDAAAIATGAPVPDLDLLGDELGSGLFTWNDPLIVEDRRRFYPSTSVFGFEPARRLVAGLPARLSAGTTPSRRANAPGRPLEAPRGVFFQAPAGVVACVRRKARKAVLHAKGIAGSKRVRRRPGRRGPYSGVSCGRR